jgi:hypothetical protein
MIKNSTRPNLRARSTDLLEEERCYQHSIIVEGGNDSPLLSNNDSTFHHGDYLREKFSVNPFHHQKDQFDVSLIFLSFVVFVPY